MKNLVKLLVTGTFGVFALAMVLSGSKLGEGGTFAQAVRPTPPANVASNTNVNRALNTNAAVNTNGAIVTNTAANTTKTPAPVPNDKKIPKVFILGKDSLTEYGEVFFDHDTHAFEKYSPDGKSVVACVDCHHTDQPKSALKPPLVTSERDVVLTMEVWLTTTQKVSQCRSCHFQDGNVPDGQEMPTADYIIGGKKVTKELNNELAYHLNCNTCHDAAAKLRPELKGKKGFATSTECMSCHKPN